MWDGRTSRSALVGLYLAVVAAGTAAVWHTAFVRALGPLAEGARSDLELAGERVVTELQHYLEVTVLTAEHPGVWGPRPRAETVLQESIDKTGSLGAVVIGRDGRIRASVGVAFPVSRDDEFVERAFQGAMGRALAVLDSRGPSRVALFAAPRFASGQVLGALVTAVDLAELERDWRGTLPAVLFFDEAGRIVSTNRSELLFWERGGSGDALSPTGRRFEVEAREVGGYTLVSQDWSSYVPREALMIEIPLPVVGMTSMTLVGIGAARDAAHLQAAVVAAVALFLGALLFLATERRRALAKANDMLEARVAERSAALAQAQAELVRAEKLSALGQMSAGISHELNQPLMAIGGHAENGAAFLERGRTDRAAENFRRIADLSRRMGRIIRNLRAFARQEAEPLGEVDLAVAVEGALDMVHVRAEREGVILDWDRPAAPVPVIAGEVRLGQVVLNLVTNALDAMAESEERRLRLSVVEDGAQVRLLVEDTGPGIKEPDRIFDPFYSTKEVGASEGMGLGLSISYGLVQGFGGALLGENTGTGARFTLTLERAETEMAA
ncbi:sensor histidine kinase [Litorisediminicola beolgyonensis]|uniref:histidine kinase n=1 Tax=Litorisediminicola beolgyonensis TaxID=1173614 RepID=A0ABW3ZFH1_9RHOB